MLNRFLAAGGVYKLRTTAFGLYDGCVAGLIERCTDHLNEKPKSAPREVFHILHAEAILLATGASERSIAFGDNDRPGVMLASAVQSYINRFGVAPGRRIVFTGTHDGIYENAIEAAKAGLHVTLLDTRHNVSETLLAQCEALGISHLSGCVPVKALGRSGVVGLEYSEKNDKNDKNNDQSSKKKRLARTVGKLSQDQKQSLLLRNPKRKRLDSRTVRTLREQQKNSIFSSR